MRSLARLVASANRQRDVNDDPSAYAPLRQYVIIDIDSDLAASLQARGNYLVGELRAVNIHRFDLRQSEAAAAHVCSWPGSPTSCARIPLNFHLPSYCIHLEHASMDTCPSVARRS